MKISLLRETVSVKRFHKETNAVYLHQPDIDDKLTEISEDEMENSEYLAMPVYKGAKKKYFRSDKYATEHPEVDGLKIMNTELAWRMWLIKFAISIEKSTKRKRKVQ